MVDPTPLRPGAEAAAPEADDQALKAYKALDLSDGSALCAELMAGLEMEQSTDGRIELTDELDIHPHGMTPQMVGWFNGNIQPLRTAALQAVVASFGGSSINKGGVGRGTLVEAERAKNDRDRIRAYNRIHTDLRRNHSEVLEERDTYRREFEEARAERGNRDPVMTNPLLYWGGLIAVVGIEIAINFESLRKLPMIKSGMFAVGLALLIGLAVGFAAHVQGTVLKQWHYWFNEFDPTRKYQAMRKMGIAAALLALSLGMIAWARTFYLMPLIELAEVTGEDPPNMFLSMMFMTLSNVIVYGVGVVWPYFHHDLDPEYPPKKIRADKAAAKANIVTRQIAAQLKEADDKAAQRDKQLDALDKSQKASPDWGENSKALASFKAVDRKVEAALQRYRSALVKQLDSRGGSTSRFIQPVVTRDDAGREEVLSGSAWLARSITLKLL